MYSNDPNAKKIMEDVFDMDKLELAFGGNDIVGFNINKYAERMREDDKKIPSFWTKDSNPSEAVQPTLTNELPLPPISLQSDSDASDKERAENAPSSTHINLESDSDTSDKEKAENSPSPGVNSGGDPVDNNAPVSDKTRNGAVGYSVS